MGTIKEVLSSSPVFKSLESADVEKVGMLFEKREISPGDVIAAACESAQNFFILAKGTLLLGMEEGKSVVLSHEGDFAAMELLSAKGIYKTSVSVLEKGWVYVISRGDFLELIQGDSPAAGQIMDAWQAYLELTAPFAKNLDDQDLGERF